MYVVFIGPPGAGKGTQSQKLVEFLRIPHLSTGDMLRRACEDYTDVGLQAQAYMDAGQLVPDALMVQVVERRLQEPDCAQGCLFDGFPRTLVQARALDRYLEERNTPLDMVLEMRVDVSVLEKRLAGRGRTDDRPEIVRERLKMFYDRIKALLDYYDNKGLLHEVDGLGTPEVVFERIKSALNSKQTT